MRERRRCRECGGSGICQHDRRRSECKECRVPRKTQRPGVVHIVKTTYRAPSVSSIAMRHYNASIVEGVALDGTNLLLGLSGNTEFKEENSIAQRPPHVKIESYPQSLASNNTPPTIDESESQSYGGAGAVDLFAQAIAMQEGPATVTATVTESSSSYVEKRIDIADGQAYTKEQFVACYGNTGKWDRARIAGEMRIDALNGMPYDRHQFLTVYGNLDKWNVSQLKQ